MNYFRGKLNVRLFPPFQFRTLRYFATSPRYLQNRQCVVHQPLNTVPRLSGFNTRKDAVFNGMSSTFYTSTRRPLHNSSFRHSSTCTNSTHSTFCNTGFKCTTCLYRHYSSSRFYKHRGRRKGLSPISMKDSITAVHGNVDGTRDVVQPRKFTLVEGVQFLPYRLQKGEVDGVMRRFQADQEIIDEAKKQGLNDQQFKNATNSFRTSMRKQFRKNAVLHSVVCAIDSNQAHLQDLFPFFLKHANELYPIRNCDVEQLRRISDLRGPPDLFPKARQLKRKIIYHAGPTNSGKTHAAVERFKASKSGVYCSPLRLLAAEVYRRTNESGVPCDLITGEERLWAVSEDEPSSHVACTVEMSSTKYQYDCAVIDEIQMMRDISRGWAWTRALLGMISKEIHVCGEDTAIDLIQSIADVCGDELEVLKYDRLGPLKLSPYHLGGNLSRVRPGDCVVAFSQRELFTLRQRIEKTTGNKCAIVYGGLPPATRVEQAARFNDSDSEYNILVASDAIGMGLNLNIRRIVFYAMTKYDGYCVAQLSPSHTKQIAGRAGRFGSDHQVGEVTTLYGRDFGTLRKLLGRPSEIVQAAGLAPSFEQIEMLSRQLPDANLSRLLEVFLSVVQLDGDDYFMCDLESVQFLADLIDGIPLSVSEQYTICQAPVSKNKALSSTVIVEFARYVSKKKGITSNTLKAMISWPPTMPKSLKGLQETETIHEVCDAYLWLSYRFPEIFVDQEEVRQMQRFIENVIGVAVSSNLKQRRIPIDKQAATTSNPE